MPKLWNNEYGKGIFLNADPYEYRRLWTLICSSIKQNPFLFVHNTIVIKRCGEINILSRHATGNTVL
jgi:hypothetical protein